MATDSTYNGWSNYETWNVALWLNNDEPLYRETLRIVARLNAADVLESWVREIAPEGFESEPYSLDDVDWGEIVASYDDE